MTFCMLIAGSSSPFLWRAAPGLLLLALLLSGSAVLSLGLRARRIVHLREERPIPMPPPRSVITMLPTAESVRKISRTVFLLSLGAFTVYALRNHELRVNTRTYTDISIIKKVADREYLIWPDRMKQQHTMICSESSVGWYEGETLADWTFEQKEGCKRVISYHEKPKGEVNASIQIGR
jgi:hypothetical protein